MILKQTIMLLFTEFLGTGRIFLFFFLWLRTALIHHHHNGIVDLEDKCVSGYVNLSYILFGIVEARSLLGLVYLSNKQSQVPIKVRERCIKAIQSVNKKENWSILENWHIEQSEW